MNHSNNKIFISHAHQDKIIAGALKVCLERLGFQAFVAHDDILPSEKWREEIIKALNECSTFIVIVSSISNESTWVNQETGYAFARGAFIIPIKTDSEDPSALINIIQGLPIQVVDNRTYGENIDIYDSCASLIQRLINSHKLGTTPDSTDILINDLISSSSFAQSASIFTKLDKITLFNEEQVDKLLDAALMNSQVRGSFDAKNFYDRLLTKNRHYSDKDKVTKVRRLFLD